MERDVRYIDAGYAVALVVLAGYAGVLVVRRRRLERWVAPPTEQRAP